MKLLSALSILVLAVFSSGYAQFDTGLEEPHVRSAELSERKVNPEDIINAASDAADVIDTIADVVGDIDIDIDSTGPDLDIVSSMMENTYGRGAGRIPDKKPCPAGLRDDGVSCWSDAHIYGKGCCCTIFGCCHKCGSGYHDDGCTCRKTDVGIKVTLMQRQTCRDDEDKYGGLCYPKCRKGYKASGCCLCSRIKKG